MILKSSMLVEILLMERRQMRFIFCFVHALAVLMASGAHAINIELEPDAWVSHSLSSGQEIELGLYFPETYVQGESYPVFIDPGAFIRSDPTIFGWIAVRGWIADRAYSEGDQQEIFDFIREVTGATDKFVLVGYSAGSAPVFELAANHTDDVRGVVTIPGHPSNNETYAAVQDLKIRFIVGDHDTYWLRGARRAHQQFLDMGTDTELLVIEGGDHFLFEETEQGHDLFRWIDEWF